MAHDDGEVRVGPVILPPIVDSICQPSPQPRQTLIQKSVEVAALRTEVQLQDPARK